MAARPDLQGVYDRYLSQASCEDTADGLVISVPTTFHMNGIQPLLTTIEQTLSRPVLSIQIKRNRPEAQTARPLPQLVPLPLTSRRADTANALDAEKQRRTIPPELVSSPTFAEPIELVRRWSSSLNNGARSQCLWVHGESGSGKTWLLKQLHTQISLEKRLLFVDVTSFFHEWRRSLETKDQLSFIRKYRKEVDVLVLENVDELQGKPGTQQELLFTVGAILDRGGCVAVSSAKHPLQLETLIEPALFSRLHSGLAVEMRAPDRAFKERLWRNLLAQHALSESPLDLVMMERIFGIPVSTARKAQSLFINLISRISFKQGIDMGDVNELAAKHGNSTNTYIAGQTGFASPTEVMDRVANICGLSLGAIQGRVRRPDVSLARRFVCLALSRHLGLTNSVISNLVEKDPSTVSHALKTIEEDIQSDRHISRQWNYICSQLGLPTH